MGQNGRVIIIQKNQYNLLFRITDSTDLHLNVPLPGKGCSNVCNFSARFSQLVILYAHLF